MGRELLNSTLSSNTSTATVTANQSGWYNYSAVGTYSSGTLTPYIQSKNQAAGTAYSPLAYTASTDRDQIWLSQGDSFYATLAGAGSPSIKVTLTWAS